MNIAFFEIQDWEVKRLKNELKNHKLKFFSKPLTEQNASQVKDCDIISIFIYSKIDSTILTKLPSLRYIVTRSMGTDHINLNDCNACNVKVSSTPHYGDSSVAEHTFGLILALSRNIHRAYVRNINENHQIEGLKGFDLKGKTIGVVGVGRIGTRVIEIARGFEMNVLANDHHPNKSLARRFGFKYTSQNNLLKKSDIVSLHVPYTKKNYHLINKKTLAMMKPNAMLINTARGSLVDTIALVSALNNKTIGGAGLDVIEGEELIREERELLHHHRRLSIKKMHQLALDHKIIRNERVVFTPHIAFYSEEAVQRIIDTTIEDINSFTKNKLINKV